MKPNVLRSPQKTSHSTGIPQTSPRYKGIRPVTTISMVHEFSFLRTELSNDNAKHNLLWREEMKRDLSLSSSNHLVKLEVMNTQHNQQEKH